MSEADKERIWHFLSTRDPDYADRMEQRFEEQVALLSRFPGLGRSIGDTGLRKLSMPDTQYVVLYRIEDDVIRVMRIYSTREDWGPT